MKQVDDSSRVAEVLRLGLVEGVAVRAIARRLHMARKTVRRILGRHHAPPKPAAEPRGSVLDPYESAIRAVLDDAPEMLAPAVLERLRPLGYTGGVTILRDRLRRLRSRGQHAAFLTLDFSPGEAMQVDWADFGFALPGVPRRVSAFVAVLCYSRRLYIEFTLSQTMGTFLRCMERCLRFNTGTTLVDIFDNMKTVVLSHTAAATTFNQKFLEYARARGFAVRACNVRKANEKGRVERPIGFVRRRFWPGRRVRDLLDLSTQAVRWRDDFATVASTRSRERSRNSSSSTRRSVCSSRSPRCPSTPTMSWEWESPRCFACPLIGIGTPFLGDSPRSRSSCARTTTASPSSSKPSRSRSIAGPGTSDRTSSIPRTREVCSRNGHARLQARCRRRSLHSARLAAGASENLCFLTGSCSPS